MGYTMSREEGKIKDESIKNSNGMYPWCLKSCVSTNTPGSMLLSDFYMKMGIFFLYVLNESVIMCERILLLLKAVTGNSKINFV